MDLNRVTEEEGKVSLLQAYLDNSCEKVEVDAISMILNAGVDINHLNEDKQNCLWIAALRTNDHEVFRTLLCRGADVHCVDNSGQDVASAYELRQTKKERDVNDETLLLFVDWGLKTEEINNE